MHTSRIWPAIGTSTWAAIISGGASELFVADGCTSLAPAAMAGILGSGDFLGSIGSFFGSFLGSGVLGAGQPC